jgi:hypothetical protein
MPFQTIQERAIGTDVACVEDGCAGVGIAQEKPVQVMNEEPQ